MRVIIDTSAVMAVLLDEPKRKDIVELTKGCEVLSASSLPYEIGNALTRLVKRRRNSPDEAVSVWNAFQQMQIAITHIDVGEAVRLAIRHQLYAYDGYMLQCARETRGRLLTIDRKMREVARSEHVSLRDEDRS